MYQCAFLTLTYADDRLPLTNNGNPTARIKDFSDFIKRFRKNSGLKIRYWGNSEYGPGDLRPHYHGIIFGVDLLRYQMKTGYRPDREQQQRLRQYGINWQGYSALEMEVFKAWQAQGGIEVKPLIMERVRYAAEHHLKSFEILERLKPDQEKPQRRMSRNPGLGLQNVNALAERLKKENLYPEHMGAELLSETAKEIAFNSMRFQSAATYGGYSGSKPFGAAVGASLGGTARSQRRRKTLPIGKTLKKKIIEALGGDKRDPYDKETAEYQRLTVGNGPPDETLIKKMERKEINRINRRNRRNK